MSQAQVATAAGIARSGVSDIENGCLDGATLGLIRRVASVLGVSLPFEPRWRGADLAKLLDQRHAACVLAVVDRLTAMGWQAVPEHTFNEWGERGSIDCFAWSAGGRAVLCVEVKTRLADLQDLLSTEDRKRRLAPILGRKIGWNPRVVGSVLALPEETWARNAVTRYQSIFDAKFPMRAAEIRRWLKKPDGNAGGIWFLLNDATGDAKRRPGGSMRVRPHKLAGETSD